MRCKTLLSRKPFRTLYNRERRTPAHKTHLIGEELSHFA